MSATSPPSQTIAARMWKSISQSYRFATMFQPPCFETERIRVSDLSERHLSPGFGFGAPRDPPIDRKSTRLNSSHGSISYAVFCLKKKKKKKKHQVVVLKNNYNIDEMKDIQYT